MERLTNHELSARSTWATKGAVNQLVMDLSHLTNGCLVLLDKMMFGDADIDISHSLFFFYWEHKVTLFNCHHNKRHEQCNSLGSHIKWWQTVRNLGGCDKPSIHGSLTADNCCLFLLDYILPCQCRLSHHYISIDGFHIEIQGLL
jgi:hypothetical protein